MAMNPKRLVSDVPLSDLARVVIIGPAWSGKSTLADSIMDRFRRAGSYQPVLIDYDLIAAALGSGETHDHSASHRTVALAAWIGAVRAIRKVPQSVPVILIHAEPTAGRLGYYETTGWYVIDTDRARP